MIYPKTYHTPHREPREVMKAGFDPIDALISAAVLGIIGLLASCIFLPPHAAVVGMGGTVMFVGLFLLASDLDMDFNFIPSNTHHRRSQLYGPYGGNGMPYQGNLPSAPPPPYTTAGQDPLRQQYQGRKVPTGTRD